MDAFFTQRHSILAHLALHVSREFGVPLQDIHYDPTHLLFTGAYENAQAREGVMDRSGEEKPKPPQPPHQENQQDEVKNRTKSSAATTSWRPLTSPKGGLPMMHPKVR